VIVSMHTLYWHPRPEADAGACRRALKPGGTRSSSPTAARAGAFHVSRGPALRGTLEALRALRWLPAHRDFRDAAGTSTAAISASLISAPPWPPRASSARDPRDVPGRHQPLAWTRAAVSPVSFIRSVPSGTPYRIGITQFSGRLDLVLSFYHRI